jgi:hypothetical protein
MESMKRLLCFPLLLILAACAREEPAATTTTAAETKPAAPAPSAPQAQSLIAASPEFGDYQFTDASVTFPVSGVAMNEPARAMARKLAGAGWIAMENTGDVMLNEKSRADKRFLLRANGILDVVPLAKKEMVNVLTVRQNEDNTTSADFVWRWVPNEVGALFPEKFAGDRNARATLIYDGTSWSVLKIDALP